MAVEEQVSAYDGPQFQLVQQVMERFAQAVERSKVDVVPRFRWGTVTAEAGLTSDFIPISSEPPVLETQNDSGIIRRVVSEWARRPL